MADAHNTMLPEREPSEDQQPAVDQNTAPDQPQLEPSAAVVSWRSVLKVHPAADLFPMMSHAELVELGNDIKAHGLQQPVILLNPRSGEKPLLLDGRSRLDAMEIVGMQVVGPEGRLLVRFETIEETKDFDPIAFVVSANLHRRHLTDQQKRDLIAKLLAANPERSNNATARLAKVSDKTVAVVRKEMETTSSIPKLEKTIGADGKLRTRHRAAADRPARQGASPAQERDKATVVLSARLKSEFIETAKDLIRLLKDQRAQITELPFDKRVALVRGYLDAFGIDVSDLLSTEEPGEPSGPT